jgi:ribonuclease R
MKLEKLKQMCVHISKQEKLAQKASRDSIKYKQAEYMSSRIGKVYSGIVCSVTDYGLFVSMPETSCEGMVRLTDIEGDTYVVEPGKYTAKGINTGYSIRLGDDVMVIVRSVDLERKIIDLVLVK